MDKILEAVQFLKEKGIANPEIGIVLGTGLGKLVDEIEIIKSIDYADIPNFPIATVEFHSGKLVYGTIEGKKVLAMVGRFHFYEGYTMQEITLPIRVMKLLGIKQLVLSNAAGGINLSMKKGDLMVITDHINLLPSNPLIGKNFDELGSRFPDMSQPYNRSLNNKLENQFNKHNVSFNTGVYASVSGPNLETAAEYRYLKIIGADAVGMSTVPEVIVANHMGLPCCAISVITDLCDPDNLEQVDIEDIIANAQVGEQKLIPIIKGLIVEL